MTAIAQVQEPPTRVSDAERERTAALLRDAWVAGRLRQDELEERLAEAWQAVYVEDLWRAVRELPMPSPTPPAAEPFPYAAAWSAVLSGLGAAVFVLTFSLGFLVTLPLAATGWLLGRHVRARDTVRGRHLAKFGEMVGVLAAFASLVALAGCATIVVVAS